MIADIIPSNNSIVDSSTAKISIYFSSPVDLTTGNISIYKASNHSIRQTVSVTSKFCNLSDNGSVVDISIISSTFNEQDERYYLKIDNNFAKAVNLNNNPLRGIKNWFFNTSAYTAPQSETVKTAVTGLAVITVNASKKFLTLSATDRSKYINTLLDEFAYKVPIRRERLSSDSDKIIQDFDEIGQIAIPVSIEPTNRTENTVPRVFSNLNQMILHKRITTFSTNMTNDLNSTLGFRPLVSGDDSYGKVKITNVTPSNNSIVDSSTTNISIYFSSPIKLTTGYISIHKASNHTIRQNVSVTSKKHCTLSNDWKIVYISILNSTFNEDNETYYVKINNNFARDIGSNNEPLRGIEKEVWFLNSGSRVKHSDGVVTGLIQLDPNASQKFLRYSPSHPEFYFDLRSEIRRIIYTVYNGVNDPVVGEELKEWVNHKRKLVIVLTILASTDYEYLTILKDAPIFTKVTIDYRYLAIIKDVTKKEIDEYLKILEDVPVSDEPNKSDKINILKSLKDVLPRIDESNESGESGESVESDELNKSDKINQINILKSLKDVLPRIDESNESGESGESDESDEIKQIKIKNLIKQIKTFRQIFRYAIICGAFFDIFFRNIPQIIIQMYVQKSTVVPFSEEKYNTSRVWCPDCDPEEETKETQEWEINDKDIEEAIKYFQREAKEYDKVIEWIPYNDLNDLTKPGEIKWVLIEEQEEVKEKLYLSMATWTKGIRTIEYKSGSYIRSRIKSCVDLIKLGSSQTNSSVIIKKLEDMMKGNHKIYGITQDVKTEQYTIVLDYYYDKRKEDYGKCEQSVEYDNFIEWIQYNDLTGIDKIEWIPMDGNKLQEIEEKSEQLDFFMASWKIRTIKNESGGYTRSRSESQVDLIKLLNSQATTSDFIKKAKKYKIYGITMDMTEQYMIVLDYYSNKRDKRYGECKKCKRPNTNLEWCQSCDPSVIKNESLSETEDYEINKCIKEFQLKATAYEKIIEWIPYKKLSNIEEIGKGGFGTVYSAIWLDGKRTVEKGDSGHQRSRRLPYVVALKSLPGSKTIVSSVLNEFKNHMKCRLEGAELEMYGLTQNTENNNYLMVYQYVNKGNLRKFLREHFSELTWQKKLEQLEYMSKDLHQIHKAGFTHCDFHSGNILLNQNLNGIIKSYIADLGLSRKIGDDSEDEIHGVIQYVAPEVFLSGNQNFTQLADIYGFGVIMAEITGKSPYEGHEADTKLAVKICKGLRPEFLLELPIAILNGRVSAWIKIQNRPSALVINGNINDWLKKLASDDENEIKKQFLSADETIKTFSIVLQKYSYHTKKINKQEILKGIYLKNYLK
ncbi:hypothetical protein C2G38_2029544 [Gigaspora rosea]|uniref:Protein kinase domain-containing protein n=1 Tax=Gigaspora rosea TaxID=44941 RepID=A0A397W7B2_9GLOM|nr:hypothetical protein C2G38_2029544 [Gigaspora rosea]